MSKPDHGLIVNLENLRFQLTERLSWLAVAMGAVGLWWVLPQEVFLPHYFLLWVGVLLLGLLSRVLNKRFPRWARHGLIWGGTGILGLSMWFLGIAWLPFWAIPVLFAGELLIRGSSLGVTTLVMALALYLNSAGLRAYPLWGLGLALLSGSALVWLVGRTLFTAIDWAITMQQRADDLLATSRRHQGELAQTLKSLDVAHQIQQRTERELIVARQQAEKARRLKEQFAANISHELRTPLNIILGFSEVMYLSPEVYGEFVWPRALQRDLHHIYRNSSHLLEMINDILDLSHFEMTGFRLQKEPTPLAPLLQSAVDIAEDLFGNKGVKLSVDIAPDLPLVEVDRTRIRQVVLNLLKNAQTFTTEGVVQLTAQHQDNEVLVCISDTGAGIPPEQLPHIFDEFYQADYARRNPSEGSGLGLAICQHFIHNHGGRIWVESELGHGSSFYFALPIPLYGLHLSEMEAYPGEGQNGHQPLGPVLVVDDDAYVGATLQRYLGGYEVIQVETSADLSTQVKQYHPQAILYNRGTLPAQVAQALTTLSVPSLACLLPTPNLAAQTLGLQACLIKPVTAQQLLDKLEPLFQSVNTIKDILIIDDDRGFGQFLQRLLASTGRDLNLHQVYDGTTGLEAISTRPPDLILLDLVMPNMDGLAVLQAIKKEAAWAAIPIILLSATDYLAECVPDKDYHLSLRYPATTPSEALAQLPELLAGFGS